MAKHETSTQYRWPTKESGLVDAIEIVRQKNGRAVAYLHAKEGPAEKQQRLEVRAALRLKGWGTLSNFRGEQYVLRVSGLNDEAELLAVLREAGAIRGTPSVSTNRAAETVDKPKGVVNYIRDHSLTISGIIASIGNALSIASGFARGKEIGQIGQGAAFAIADLPLAIAGERDDGRQFNNLLRHLKQHYIKNGIDIPVSASIHVETSDAGKDFGERARDYLHRYANQIKCSLEVVAAFFTRHAGKAQGNKDKMMAASIFGPGFLASLLIPEKKIDEEKYANAGALGRFWMKIQSNPLSVGGLLGYSNTFFTYKGAFDERRRFLYPDRYPTLPNPITGKLTLPTKHYTWDFAIPSVMIGANGTYAISKKTVGGDIRNEAMEGDVYNVASQILNKLPEAKREAAFESTVTFLAERPEVCGNKNEVREKLAATMTKQRENPWFEHVALTLPAPVATPPQLDVAAPVPSTLVSGKTAHVGKGIEAVNDATLQVAAGGR